MRARLLHLLLIPLVLGIGVPPAVASAAPGPAADTVYVMTDSGRWPHNRKDYRPPTSTFYAWYSPAAINGEDYITVGANDGQSSTSFSAYIGTGAALQLGHRYSNVPIWWNRASGSPGASCNNATFEVDELAATDTTITNLALDALCNETGEAHIIRINSTRGFPDFAGSEPSFGPTYPGYHSDATFTLTSTGTADLVVDEATLGYSEPIFSVLDDGCSGATLPPGDSCAMSVRFAPTSPGFHSGEFRASVNTFSGLAWTPWMPQAVDPLSVSPTSLNLGSTPATVPTVSKDVTVSFSGPGSGSVHGLSIDGAGAAGFAVADNGCDGVVLTDATSCQIAVTAAPAAVGATSATLHVDLGTDEGSREVQLSATGTDPVSITSSVTLPQIRPGTTAKALVTVTSLATTMLPVTEIALSGAPLDFSITSNACSGGIPAAGSCVVEVTYSPPSDAGVFGAITESKQLSVSGPGLLGYRTSQITGRAAVPSLGATWTIKSTIARRWHFGEGLARSVNGSVATLVQVTSSDRVGSTAVKDAGPRLPVYLNRSTNGGATWSSSVRVNPTTQHGLWPVVAASGKNVAVAWVSASKVINFSNTAPRAIWFRLSTNAGNGSWRSVVRLTSATGRVDHPSIAMAGSTILIGYTDSVTGSVKLLVSHNLGSTWKTLTLGSTTAQASWGKTGLVRVVLSGSRAGATWISAVYGSIKVRTSTNSGTSWSSPVTVGPADGFRPSIAVLGDRVAVAWDATVRIRTGSAWGPVRAVPIGYGWSDDSQIYTSYAPVYDPAVALYGTAGVAVAVSGEFSWCGGCDNSNGSELIWMESSTNGATWAYPDKPLRPDYTYVYHDDPSVIWVSPTLRYVLANSYGYAQKTSMLTGVSAGLAPAMQGPGTPIPATTAATPAPARSSSAFWGPFPPSDRAP